MYGCVYCGFCNVWVCVCVCVCGGGVCNVWVCMCGFCNVWVCVCVGFVMCGCFDNCVGVLAIRVFVYTVFFCIVSFMYIYSYLSCLY